MDVQGNKEIKTMIFCPYCGTRLDDRAKFCKNCGEVMNQSVESLLQEKNLLESQLEDEKKAREEAEEKYRQEAAKNIIEISHKNEKNEKAKSERYSEIKTNEILYMILGLLFLMVVVLLVRGNKNKEDYNCSGSQNENVVIKEDNEEEDSYSEKDDEEKYWVQSDLDTEIKIEQNEYLGVKDFGWYVSGGYLSCVIELENLTEKAIEYPTFRVTAYDEDKKVMGTDDQVLSVIYPQQTFVCDYLLFEVAKKPSEIVVTVLEPEDYNISDVSMLEHAVYKEMEGVNISVTNDLITGEIYNPNDYKIDSAMVTIVFRDATGSILEGEEAFVEQIPAGGRVPFSVKLYFEDEVPPNYEVFAYMW